MMPFQALIAAQHLADLQREAAASRLVREAAAAGGEPRPPRGTDTRRLLARAAARLSQVADGAARRLDPALEECLGTPRAMRAAGR